MNGVTRRAQTQPFLFYLKVLDEIGDKFVYFGIGLDPFGTEFFQFRIKKLGKCLVTGIQHGIVQIIQKSPFIGANIL